MTFPARPIRRDRPHEEEASHATQNDLRRRRRARSRPSLAPLAQAQQTQDTGVAAAQLVPGRPARAVLLRQGARLLQGRGHRPHDQRGPRLGQHRAGRGRRVRHLRHGRLVVGDHDRRQGRRDQVGDVAAQLDRLLGRVARGEPASRRRRTSRASASRSRPAIRSRALLRGGVQGEQGRLQQDLAGAGRPGGEGGHRAREEGRRAARRRRRPVLPDQVSAASSRPRCATPTGAPTSSA